MGRKEVVGEKGNVRRCRVVKRGRAKWSVGVKGRNAGEKREGERGREGERERVSEEGSSSSSTGG